MPILVRCLVAIGRIKKRNTSEVAKKLSEFGGAEKLDVGRRNTQRKVAPVEWR